jgi:hypothetical protein
MKQKTMKAVAKNAYGKQLATPIPYEFSWSTYENSTEMKQANDGMSDDEQVKQRNKDRKAKARQAAWTAALDAAGIKAPTLENDDQFRLREFLKVLLSSPKYKGNEEAARAKASETLGIEWADDEDED